MNGNGHHNSATASLNSTLAPRTLIADDQPDVLAALRLLLKTEGFQIETVSSPIAALEAIKARPFDLVLMDLNYARDTTSGREGLDLLAQIRAVDRTLPVVVMTAWSSVELAVEAMREGSGDFIQKPWDNLQLLAVLRRQLAIGETLRREASILKTRERENHEALEIQRRLMPQTLPTIEGLDIAFWWQPARDVGGDYFDVWRLNENRLAICMADVVGKGMPAALLMANLQAAVKSLAAPELAPADLCEQLNRLISANVEAGKYITFFYGVIDLKGRRLEYVNAAHCAPLLVSRNGQSKRLSEGGFAIGMFAASRYSAGTLTFASGDRLALFTDGVSETRNSQDDEFGDERLLELMVEHRSQSATAIQKTIEREIEKFGEGELGDDATLLIVAID